MKLCEEVKPVPRGSETILLVDPEPEARKLAIFMLQKQGYSILEARTAAEALQLFETQRDTIHLLLTEIHIPRMNGRDLAARLTAVRPGLRVLYLSGARAVADQGRAILPKPFIMRELAGKVRQVLDAPLASAVSTT